VVVLLQSLPFKETPMLGQMQSQPLLISSLLNHADDRAICFDMTFLPLVQAVVGKCPGVKHWVALCEAELLSTDSGLPELISCEAWMSDHRDICLWPVLDENSASSMCNTTGTTCTPPATPRLRCIRTAHPLACLQRCAARFIEPERPRRRVACGAHVPR
jgi:hypothetical protein